MSTFVCVRVCVRAAVRSAIAVRVSVSGRNMGKQLWDLSPRIDDGAEQPIGSKHRKWEFRITCKVCTAQWINVAVCVCVRVCVCFNVQCFKDQTYINNTTKGTDLKQILRTVTITATGSRS